MEQFANSAAAPWADWERNIFRYHNGIEEVWGDPDEIFLTVAHLLGCHPNQAIAQIGKITAVPRDDGNGNVTVEYKSEGEVGLVALEAARKLAEAVDTAFGLAPFDPKTGAGTTNRIRWTAWQRLIEFNSKKNGHSAAWQTSSQLTG